LKTKKWLPKKSRVVFNPLILSLSFYIIRASFFICDYMKILPWCSPASVLCSEYEAAAILCTVGGRRTSPLQVITLPVVLQLEAHRHSNTWSEHV